jgi:DNA repair protein RadC
MSDPKGTKAWTVREAVVKYLGRSSDQTELPDTAIRCPSDVASLLHRYIEDEGCEHFFVLALNGRHKTISLRLVSKGTPTASLVHPREVFQVAIAEGSIAIVLAHNHPSGDPTPSAEDNEVTRRIAQAGKLLGIPVLDHVVVGHGRLFSYHEQANEFLEVRGTP